jgi:lysophospholipase L1-like esterase
MFLLVGDSITEWNPIEDRHVLKYGFAGYTTGKLLSKLEEERFSEISSVLLMVGVNDLNFGEDFENSISNYSNIVKRLKTVSKDVYCISLLPTKKMCLNKKIKDFNRELRVIARKNDVNYVGIYDLFLKDGVLREDYSLDFVHLNEKGYDVLNEELENIFNKKLGSVEDGI